MQNQKTIHRTPGKKNHTKKAQKKIQSRRAFGIKSILGLGFIFAALVAVVVAPSPYTEIQGGILLVGSKPEASVYGPELPENIVPGYSTPIYNSNVIIEGEEEDNTLYVYAAEGAERYHLGTCKFAYASAQRLTIMEAHFLGYEACGRCDPPTYAEYYG